jgi:tetratricopeptide (TPR) repeat protein
MWHAMAEECKDRGNWEGAEEALKKVLELALGEENPLLSVKPRIDLARLQDISGKYEEAAGELQKALATARAGEMTPLVLMVLEAKARLELNNGFFDEARRTLVEALGTLPAEKLYDTHRARIMLLQGEEEACNGKYDNAEILLRQAEILIRPYSENPSFGGSQSLRAQIAEISAKICAARGQTSEAAEIFSRAIEHLRNINDQPHLAGGFARRRLAVSLSEFAKHLDAAGKHDDAKRARDESAEMMPKPEAGNAAT